MLLSRDEFRATTLARFGGACVVPACREKAVDAHHILNRNLFTEPDELGGYFARNGAGLCSAHHLDAEVTRIAASDLYVWCEVERILPHSMESCYDYDTWGNIVISEHERIAGPLFDDEGCRKALAAGGVLWTVS